MTGGHLKVSKINFFERENFIVQRFGTYFCLTHSVMLSCVEEKKNLFYFYLFIYLFIKWI